jgi:chemotaxis receptor (MCP) glutamine deamidase CheD
MSLPTRTVEIPPDHFETVADDAVLVANVHSTAVACVYDAVEEPGAMLHLRFIARGDHRLEMTDTTLATDLLLLDRCIEQLRAVAPRAQNLQGRIIAHVLPDEISQRIADSVLMLMQDFLQDAGVKIVGRDVDHGATRRVKFRPAMGQIGVEGVASS